MKKNYILCFLFAIFPLICLGCSNINTARIQKEDSIKKIAVLGKEAYVYADESFLHGMELALKEENKEALQWQYYDDEGDYEKGLVMAGQLAEDDNVIAVFSFQDFEVINAEASYFEKAEKPLFAVQGCYETTLEQGYDYIFSSYLSSKDMGIAMAKYCAKEGYQRVVCSHTDTAFEKDEMIGFCAQAKEEGISIVDMQQGPDDFNNLEVSYNRWEKLGADALYICKYTENVEQKEWIFKLIQYIKEKNPDFLIMGDYSLNGETYLKQYGNQMENVVYPNPYAVEENTVLAKDFVENYKTVYGETEKISDSAYQGYDITKMVCKAVEQGDITGKSIKNFFKAENGYQGVSGRINYSEDGKIKPQIEYYRVHDGIFVTIPPSLA